MEIEKNMSVEIETNDGRRKMVPLEILTRVRGTKLGEMARKAKDDGTPIKINASFRLLLLVESYIVANFDKAPDLLRDDEKDAFRELLDSLGLTKRAIAMHALQEYFNREPVNAKPKAVEVWVKLGPFDLYKVTQMPGCDFDDTLEIHEGHDNSGQGYFQQFNSTFDKPVFGRHVTLHGAILEGQSLNDSKFLEGFGRMIYGKGQYYEGMCKMSKKHGRGKYVYTDGRTMDGEWKENKWAGEVED